MKLTLICTHCGRDYGLEYHRGMDPGDGPRPSRYPDVQVCDHCCRDTNPSAGPSQWAPASPELETGAPLTVYAVRRQCACGTEWMSMAFTKPADGEVRGGLCPECLAKEDARLAALVHPVVDRGPSKATTLERPQSAREYGEDELPFDRKQIAAGELT